MRGGLLQRVKSSNWRLCTSVLAGLPTVQVAGVLQYLAVPFFKLACFSGSKQYRHAGDDPVVDPQQPEEKGCLPDGRSRCFGYSRNNGKANRRLATVARHQHL